MAEGGREPPPPYYKIVYYPGQMCPTCLTAQLVLCFMLPDEKLLICEDEDCPFPFGCVEHLQFYKVDWRGNVLSGPYDDDDVVAQKASELREATDLVTPEEISFMKEFLLQTVTISFDFDEAVQSILREFGVADDNEPTNQPSTDQPSTDQLSIDQPSTSNQPDKSNNETDNGNEKDEAAGNDGKAANE
ncbi:uncharacterized protein LOC142986767 [Anticarsia gemmatalis]|uniref:uncharacterized protein LOC142986767 n=1 Tax=Anticarsia gemmatalis TaxID=129554 RepID=UPI003F765E7F